MAVAITPTAEGKFHAVWSYSAEDVQRTFTIAYRVRCAVDAFQDTAHLLWQFIGDGWGVPSHRVRVTVHIPGTASRIDRPSMPCPRGHNNETFTTKPLQRHDIRAWGHGPFNGNVSIPDPQTVVLTVNEPQPVCTDTLADPSKLPCWLATVAGSPRAPQLAA